MLKYLVFVISLLVCFNSMASWNKPTHMLSASIAYQILKRQNPKVLSDILTILKKHPHYHALWEKKLIGASDAGLYLFMLAARWADDLKNSPYSRFSNSKWHYINIPGDTKNVKEFLKTYSAYPESIVSAFYQNIYTFKTSEEKAIALTWLFHIIGDCHQPLHTVSFFSNSFPDGDKGGNNFYVKYSFGKKLKTTNLHSLWDNILINTDQFRSIEAYSSALIEKINPEKTLGRKLSKKDFKEWTIESFNSAQGFAYLNYTLAPGTSNSSATMLPSDYMINAKREAEERIVLAGCRLANVLRELENRN